MTDANAIACVVILDRTYKVKCHPEEVALLEESAQQIDEKMRKLAQNSHSSADQIAVITALNICHELLTLKKQMAHSNSLITQRLQAIQHRIENSLASHTDIIV